MNPLLESLRQSGRLRRADVALGHWVSRAFANTPAELALAAALAARAVGDGHGALELARAQTWLDALDGNGASPVLPELAAWREILSQAPQVCATADAAPCALTPLVLDAQGRLYLRRYFKYEQQLAHALIERTRAARSATPSLADSRWHGLDADQARAVRVALTQRFTLITGGPGSGKTFVVAHLLAALAGQAHTDGRPLRIALAAPTGKAAARLGESLRQQLAQWELPAAVGAQIPREALTLHKLLGLSPWRNQPAWRQATPLPVDVVVVDEVSMVDLPLMAKLVDAVPRAARLVLLGDPEQLAAVEAGNVLGALVEAAQHGTLRDCHVALRHSHRFGADSTLGALAAAIARGDGDIAVQALHADVGPRGYDDRASARLLDAASEACHPMLDAATPAAALRAARSFRVLTALRQGPLGCIEIDRAMAQRLQRRAGVRAEQRWWRGRLILITANRPELRLWNGDTGVVWPAANGELLAWFEGADDTPRGLPLAALPPHEGAFALTVHKAQGSEFERVLLVTGPDSAVLTRELLYTGVTRARSQVEIHSTPDILRAGIQRRTLRMGGLAERLREALTSP